MIQNSFIDMESMFKLFEEEEEVSCSTFLDVSFENTLKDHFFSMRRWKMT